jgi:hypothetical protein
LRLCYRVACFEDIFAGQEQRRKQCYRAKVVPAIHYCICRTATAPVGARCGRRSAHHVLPKFGERKITGINREDIQNFLAEKARKYSESTLRSMRVVLGLTLGWANNCGWLEKNPCTRVKLPKRTGGRRVTRTILTAGQMNAIAEKLKEPYATLILFLVATGLRIGEAIAIKLVRYYAYKNFLPDYPGNLKEFLDDTCKEEALGRDSARSNQGTIQERSSHGSRHESAKKMAAITSP